MDRRGDLVLALVGAGGDPDRALADGPAKGGERLAVGGGRRRVEFEVAGDRDGRRAQSGVAPRVGLALREAEGEAREERLGDRSEAAPAGEGPLRQAAIDDDHRGFRGRRAS